MKINLENNESFRWKTEKKSFNYPNRILQNSFSIGTFCTTCETYTSLLQYYLHISMLTV